MSFLITLALIALVFLRRVPKTAHLVDGDTIDVKGVRWRLAGFDAPEIRQPGGSEATRHLRDILSRSTCFALVYGRDVYGRRIARIYTLRGPLSFRMIASGHAFAVGFAGIPPMLWARILRRGLWASNGRIVHPRIWRAQHPWKPRI